MKKILLALVLALAVLVPIQTVTAASASARGCVDISKSTSNDVFVGDTHIFWSATVFYKKCTYSATTSRLRQKITVYNPDCNPIVQYKMNVNKIGDHDPGQWSRECSISYAEKNTYPTEAIYASHPANERCFAMHLEVDKWYFVGSAHYDTPSVCII